MSQYQLAPQFSEIFRKFIILRQAYREGKIDNAFFLAQVQQQILKDQDGRIWRLDETGNWHWHNGREWIPREPPRVTLPPVNAKKPPSTNNKKSTWLFIAIPIIVVFLCLCLILVIALGGFTYFKDEILKFMNPDSPTIEFENETNVPIESPINEAEQFTETDLMFVLSEQQQIVYEEFDWPDSFMIMEVDDIEGRQVRLETWDYYGGKTSFTFSDGEFLVDGETETLPLGFLPTPFRPDMFILGSSFEEIQTLLAFYPLIPSSSSPALQEGVEIYAGQQLILGFLNDRLFYVDAMAFVPEGIE